MVSAKTTNCIKLTCPEESCGLSITTRRMNEMGLKWIISNSKKCPGCGFYIERNQGCNHMTCRHPNCGYEFCWMCGADWKTHGSGTGGYYKCNIYESKKADSSVYD